MIGSFHRFSQSTSSRRISRQVLILRRSGAKGNASLRSGARVATWPCHLCGLVSHLSSRSNRTSFQLPLPKDSISATLFSHPLPNALISSLGALSSLRFALPSRDLTPYARCNCSAVRDGHAALTTTTASLLRTSSSPSQCRLVPRVEYGANRGYPIPVLTRYAQTTIPRRLARYLHQREHLQPCRLPFH